MTLRIIITLVLLSSVAAYGTDADSVDAYDVALGSWRLAQQPLPERETFALPDSASFVHGEQRPAPYLTHTGGFLPIKAKSRSQLLDDLAGPGVRVVEEDKGVITLASQRGWTITFYLNAQDMGDERAMNAELSGDSFLEQQQAAYAFRHELQDRGLTDAYLIRNRFFDDERFLASLVSPTSKPVAVPVVTTAALASDTGSTLLLIPNLCHLYDSYTDSLAALVRRLPLDWIALRIFNRKLQEVVDDYVFADTASRQFRRASAKLAASFGQRFNVAEGEPDEVIGHIGCIKILNAAKERRLKVMCIASMSSRDMLYRNNPNAFGGAIRCLRWAFRLPSSGRGAIVAAPQYFNSDQPYNVQDFVSRISPSMRLLTLTPLNRL